MEVTVGNRRAEVAGRKPRGQAEGSGKQTFDRRNTNRQRGRVRAVSVLATAKPKIHTKTCQVEPDGTKGQNQRLTWGELPRESGGEVSSVPVQPERERERSALV